MFLVQYLKTKPNKRLSYNIVATYSNNLNKLNVILFTVLIYNHSSQYKLIN